MSRFIDNQDKTITDTKTNLVWSKEDSWQMEEKWMTWDEAKEFVHHLSDLKLGGKKEGWRLPTISEAKSLYDPDQINVDKYEKEIHLDPIFPGGPQSNMWIEEISTGNEGYFLDFKTGEVALKFKSIAGRMAARGVWKGK